ncbi:MAG: hypothetical protein Q8N22_00110 [bacterium]|nr:hypothetical protein [bacterium]
MEQPIQSTNKKNVLIYAAAAVLVAVSIGLFIGYYLGAALEKNKAGEFQEEAMLKEVFSSALFVNNLSGKILEISSDKKFLIVEVPGVYGVNLPKNYQEKRILIDENTKIVLRETKDLAVFEKEMNELKKKGEITPPFPYVEKEIKVDDLTIGDAISFNFPLDENISILSAQFTAVQINVNR